MLEDKTKQQVSIVLLLQIVFCPVVVSVRLCGVCYDSAGIVRCVLRIVGSTRVRTRGSVVAWVSPTCDMIGVVHHKLCGAPIQSRSKRLNISDIIVHQKK